MEEKMDGIDFRSRLSSLMHSQELSYGKLADKAGISKSSVYRLVSSQPSDPVSYPTIDTAAKLADALGVSLDYLACHSSDNMEAGDRVAYASEVIGLTTNSVKTINRIVNSTYDPIRKRIFDPWGRAEMVQHEPIIPGDYEYLDECRFSGPSAGDVISSFFDVDNYSALYGIIDLVREYTMIRFLSKHLKEAISTEKELIEDHPECERDYLDLLEKEYTKQLQKSERAARSEIIYLITNLLDKMADAYKQTDADLNEIKNAVTAMHDFEISEMSPY